MSECDLNYRDLLQEIERYGGVPSDKPFFIKRCQVRMCAEEPVPEEEQPPEL